MKKRIFFKAFGIVLGSAIMFASLPVKTDAQVIPKDNLEVSDHIEQNEEIDVETAAAVQTFNIENGQLTDAAYNAITSQGNVLLYDTQKNDDGTSFVSSYYVRYTSTTKTLSLQGVDRKKRPSRNTCL